jgi:6-phosphogluconolactonase (cycloisomerase 2 family)
MRSVRSVLLVGLLALTGCGKFFQPETGGGGGTTSGDLLYVANSNASNLTIAGFTIASAKLSVTNSSPYSVGVTPYSVAVTPDNAFLYVGTLAGIYVYTINSDGSLTVGNSGTPVGSSGAVAMKVDTTGGYLLAADTSPAAYLYTINSDGTLTADGSAVPLDSGNTSHMVISPSDQLVYISLGTGGVDILTFDNGSATLSKTNLRIPPRSSGNSDAGLATDPNGKYLFVTETGVNGVRMMNIGSTGNVTEVSGSPFKTGLGPSSVMVDDTGAYVYVTNRTDGTVSGFTLTTSGTLSALSGSPFAINNSSGKANAASAPVDIVEDNTSTYVAVACAGGSPDLAVFNFDTTTLGKLDSFATATTGSDPTQVSAVAATH